MDDWGQLNKTLLSQKEEFYSRLNMKGITDTDYMHTKGVHKNYETKI